MRYIKVFSCVLPLSLTLGAMACSSTEHQKSNQTTAPAPEQEVVQSSRFDADSAYRFVSEQVAFGSRMPGSEGHRRCGDWIVSHLKRWGYNVIEQTFSGKDYFGKSVTGRNIIATMDADAPERVLLMAHWDTRAVADYDPSANRRSEPILGADDGGSGVGVLLEIAREHSQSSTRGVELDFVFFDLEDGGNSRDNDSWCLGAQYWSKHPHKTDYKARYGILLDMVGAKDAKFYWEGYSKAYASPILFKLWDTARSLGWGNYFVSADGGEMVDDHVPVIKYRGIPSVDIINYSPNRTNGFGEHWHTHGDNLNIISKTTLQAVGESVTSVLLNEK